MFPQLSVAVHVLVITKASSHPATDSCVSSKVMSTFGSQLSFAVTVFAAGAFGTASHSTVTSLGTPANTGAVLSPTSILCDPVAVFPQLSVAVHVLVITKASSHPATDSCVSSKVMSTFGSQLSFAVTVFAAGAFGTASHSTVTSLGTPANIGAVLSPTSILCDPVAVFPQLSVAVQIRTIV